MTRKIAIIGMSFRFPGTTADTYWADLLAGKDMVTSVDPARWALDTFRHPRKSHPGTSYTFAAGTLGDISGFDAGFFGISPREAGQMDPQQRLLLELTQEAFEGAGMKPAAIKGSRTGVYIGISSADYSYRFADDLGAVDSTVATGNTTSIAANRISYVFDLRGPSMAIDTACSSSMVAFHQACQSIRAGESSLAISGGVSLHLHPYGFIAFSKASMLSRQGKCRVFDAGGDGYVRSEGGGILILKDYDKALADGDRILALVAGTGINSDGRKSGLTVPSSEAQAGLLRDVYADAGIDPSEIDYLEAHGTGTAVGDPIETHALGEALGKRRPTGSPLLIGSVKSNMGHLEAASGIAGLVKVIHCLQHRTVPATIHFERPNPNIQFDAWNLRAVTQPQQLRPTGKVTIGVNSFGFGGANAHAILESVPSDVTAIDIRTGRQSAPLMVPLIISGKSREALKQVALDYAARLSARTPLYDLAYAAAFQRDWHQHRAVVYAEKNPTAADLLQRFAVGQDTTDGCICGEEVSVSAKVAFVYSGNGSQWPGMGQRLMAESDVFRDAVLRVDAVFRPLGGFSIADEFSAQPATDRYSHTDIAQPALFAYQVGVTEMLKALGIRVDVVTGHSVGEVAAAWAAGALTLEQAVHVVFHRSRLQETTRGNGAMLAAAISLEEFNGLVERMMPAREHSLAAINSPKGITIAGSIESLSQIEHLLKRDGRVFKRLDLPYAFHSGQMDCIESGVYKALGTLKPKNGTVSYYSTVTGDELAGSFLDAFYWWQNIRNPVRFLDVVRKIGTAAPHLFIEIGPHAVLRGYMNDSLKEAKLVGDALPTSMRGAESTARIRSVAAQVLIDGGVPDWSRIFPQRGKPVRLPTYPWQREPCWHQSTPESLNLLQRKQRHPLLGSLSGGQGTTWEGLCDTHLQPFLADHVVGDAVVFPGAGYVELAIAAAVSWLPEASGSVIEIEDLDIRAPLLLDAEHTKHLRVHVDAADGSLVIESRTQFTGDSWQQNAVARLPRTPFDRLARTSHFKPPARKDDFDSERHLQLACHVGLNYGAAFHWVKSGWVEPGGHTVIGQLRAPGAQDSGLNEFFLPPAMLDAGFQLLLHLMGHAEPEATDLAFVPTRIGRLQFRHGAGTPRWIQMQVAARSPHSVNTNLQLFDAEGVCVAILENVRFRSVRLHRTGKDFLRRLVTSAVPMPLRRGGTGATSIPPAADLLLPALEQWAAANSGSPSISAYLNEVEPLLDALCESFADEALRRYADDGGATTAEQTVSALNFSRNWLGCSDENLTPIGASEPLPPASDIYNTVLSDHPDHFAALNAVGQAGGRLLRAAGNGQPMPPAGKVEDSIASLKRHALEMAAGAGLPQVLAAVLRSALQRAPEGARLGVVEFAHDRGLWAREVLVGLDSNRCDCLQILERPPQSMEASPEERATALTTRTIPLDTSGDLHEAVGAAVAIVCNDFVSAGSALQAYRLAVDCLQPGGSLIWIEFAPARWTQFVQECARLCGRADEASPAGAITVATDSVQTWIEQSRLASEFTTYTCIPLGPPDNAFGAMHVATKTGAVGPVVQHLGNPPEGMAWVLIGDTTGEDARLLNSLEGLLGGMGQSVTACRSVAEAAELLQRCIGGNAAPSPPAGIILLPPPAADFDAINDIDTALGAADGWVGAQVAQCAALCELSRRMDQPSASLNCWVVTSGATVHLMPQAKQRAPQLHGIMGSAAVGFTRSLMNEPGVLKWRTIDFESMTDHQLVAAAIVDEVLSGSTESEISYSQSGARFAPRLGDLDVAAQRTPAATGGHMFRLGFSSPGQLRNLHWERHTRHAPGSGQIEIRVKATGLNFRDIMYSLGLLSDEAVEGGFAGPTLGLECAGIVERVGHDVTEFSPGDRVVAFGPASFADYMLTSCIAAARVPRGLSFEAAATIPSAFFTAYYALHHVAHLAPGERILIHGAAGGVGIAAIQLARHVGAEIFATAGSDDKREFVRLLGADHVFDSRSLAFADEILLATGGEGVDVVLNSLAGEAINRNLRVLRPFGRFLELGKRDFYENSKIGLRPFRNNIAFFGIDADQLMQCQPELTRRLFREMMALFADGSLHPLPYRTFGAAEVVDAFRHMQQARHIGKIVVTGYERIERAVPLKSRRVLQFAPDATWLVTGGLGGFGLRSAQWLAEHGVRHLVLAGRSGANTSEAVHAVKRLEAAGVQVSAVACDVSDPHALGVVLEDIHRSMPPLRGILHAAAVIDDALGRNTSLAQISATFAPKVKGAVNLHLMTRHLALDHFILYSSATTLFGNPGQASYVAANAALESLAAVRRARGLPATCIAWGAIGDAGFLTRHPEIKAQLVSRMGGAAIPAATALAVLEEALLDNHSNLGVMELDWRAISRFLPSASDPKFSRIRMHCPEGGDDMSSAEDIERMLAEMNDEQLTAAFIEILRTEIGEILRIAPDRIEPQRSVYDMGLDSLMGVELAMAIETRFGIRLPVMALSETPTIAKLAEKVISQLRDKRSGGASPADNVGLHVQQAVAQHAPDVANADVTQFVDDISRGSVVQTGKMIH